MEKLSPPSLAETQTLLRALITAPEPVEKTLESLSVALPVKPSATLTAPERVQIYANMYFARLHDAIMEDFPGVSACIGDTLTQLLIEGYLQAHPSTSFTLRDAGTHLASFLSEHALKEDFPYLADVARFEWELQEVYDAPNEQPLTSDALHTIPPDTWPQLALQTIAAFRLIDSEWAVDDIHEALIHQSSLEDIQLQTPTTIIVWRQGFSVMYRRIHVLEAELLNTLQSGCRFEALCHIGLECLGEAEATQAVVAFLRQWVTDGLLVSS